MKEFNNYTIHSMAFKVELRFAESGIFSEGSKCVKASEPLVWMVGMTKIKIRLYCRDRGWVFKLKRE